MLLCYCSVMMVVRWCQGDGEMFVVKMVAAQLLFNDKLSGGQDNCGMRWKWSYGGDCIVVMAVVCQRWWWWDGG